MLDRPGRLLDLRLDGQGRRRFNRLDRGIERLRQLAEQLVLLVVAKLIRQPLNFREQGVLGQPAQSVPNSQLILQLAVGLSPLLVIGRAQFLYPGLVKSRKGKNYTALLPTSQMFAVKPVNSVRIWRIRSVSSGRIR